MAHGDARIALNTLELAANLAEEGTIRLAGVEAALQKAPLLYDQGEKNTTTSSRRSSKACAAPIRTPPSTGWRG